jgi:ribonuclease D
MSYRLIATQPELDQLLQEIAPVSEIALDTEADNMYHYRNRVCLLQIRWDETTVLVDALVDLDLTPLFRLLEDKPLVMHGSDFDLRLLAGLCQFSPRKLFDTMLAAQLLGLEKIGLSSLVEHYFGVSLPKTHQKSDWSQRPLPEKMLEYAAQDVYYLFELRDLMTAKLAELGRLDWMKQRCEWQMGSGATGFAPRDDNAWRLSGGRGLRGAGLTVLYELWHWRDGEAERADRPPFKIINDNFLFAVAKAVQDGKEDPQTEVPPSLRRRHGQAMRAAIQRGLARDPSSLPPPPTSRDRPEPFSADELKRQEAIRTVRDRAAKELNIDSSLIANRQQMAILARDPSRLDELMLPWQADLLRSEDWQLSAEAAGSERRRD